MSKFQKRHYEAIAEVFGTFNEKDLYHLDDIIGAFEALFINDNPRFDVQRFWDRVKHYIDNYSPNWD